MHNNYEKIFCIGFPRTGTTSLAEALTILGFQVRGGPSDLKQAYFGGNTEYIFEFIKKHDAFQDDPWPQLYKMLDNEFPNSKFILTIRDPDKWIRSIVNYFGYRDSLIRENIFGVKHPIGNENRYLEVYNKHNSEVREHFKERASDLLVIDWEKGSSWDDLCAFLKKPIPDMPLPCKNKMNYSIAHVL